MKGNTQALLEQLKPERVTPGVVYLVSEEAPSGVVLTAGAGAFAVAAIYETEGVAFKDGATVEDIRDHWAQITDTKGQEHYEMGGAQTAKFMRKLQGG